MDTEPRLRRPKPGQALASTDKAAYQGKGEAMRYRKIVYVGIGLLFLSAVLYFNANGNEHIIFQALRHPEGSDYDMINRTDGDSTLQKAQQVAIQGDSDDRFEPAYLALHRSGELKKRAEELWQSMAECQLCPRLCSINRLEEANRGFCGATGTSLYISSAQSHFGEERPLVGRGGSGTIFFTHCSLRCVSCQNWSISHQGRGARSSISDLAEMMLQLQARGCLNINLVTPTHYIAHILKALDMAAGKGLRLPVVYNTSGWETLDTIKTLDGIVDIYLPDFKFWKSEMSDKYAAMATEYPELARKTILEMHRQVGVAKPDENGIINRGLMIRILVMPGKVSGSEEVIRWVAENLPKETYVNIMAQYSPQYQAYDYPEISRRITSDEYNSVVDTAREVGLTNLDVRGFRWLRR